ncbi:MAG TPA: type II secretion system protein, partial [Patescibacteria group bacterium]|nr:type II secretion system protein [Patescibacteria group bacterium]
MKYKQGFTLIELLIVIAIIGLLATMAIASLQNSREKAKLARCKADFKQILTAIELKRDQVNNTLLNVTGSGCSDCSCRPFNEANLSTAACINRMTTTFQNLGFTGLLKDPWNH